MSNSPLHVEPVVRLLQVRNDPLHRLRPGPGLEPAPDPVLHHRLNGGKIRLRQPRLSRYSRYSVTFTGGVCAAEASA